MFQVGVGDEHQINALHHGNQRLQQGRVEVDVPPAVQQDCYAADLRFVDASE